ncbi:polysaccharide biosynthesis protein [Methanoculleus taiwanensis]|uniref:Polysaccharide biosynthesis protein n=1 Tax=Methanoculleus taiwanensis TaxID=1550565 RepID=A0A498GY71_9EURY|nr:flippase [Methanoculleus taiwanensis]RXE55084.1 polysaccharide biosynthesis protein [Methanoculleus taiwanensis]
MFGLLLSKVMDVSPIQRQSIISLVSTVGLTAFGLLSTMYFSHTVGPAPLGAYFLFLAYFGIFTLIGDAGFGTAAVKRISEGTDQNAFFTALIALKVGLFLVTAVALVVVYHFGADLFSPDLTLWLLVALFVGALYTAVNSGTAGSGKVGISQITNLINNVSKIVMQIIAVFLGFGAGGLIGGFVAGMAVGMFVNLRYLDLRLVRFNRKHISSLSTFSFWIFLSSGGILVFNYADTVLIGYFMTEADVGIYRVAFQLTSLATFVSLALHSSLFPRVSNWSAHNEISLIESALSRAFTYSLLLALPVCVGGWLLGERLLYFLYGAPFAAGASALVILLAVQVAFVFTDLQTMSLNAMDRPRDSFRVTAVAVVVNIALNLLLIPVIGLIGAALATFVTMLLNAVLARRVLSNVMCVKLETGSVRNILVATGAMAGVTGLFGLFFPLMHIASVMTAVVLGAAVYAIVLMRLDRTIHDELQGIAVKMGVPWPSCL